MNSQRWRQIETVFHAARERQISERADFLAAACTGDEELRREVDSLLAQHEVGATVLKDAAYLIAAEWEQDQMHRVTGQTIGHFQILSLLGKGGMGEVYLAEDQKLRRKVALKLLPPEFAADEVSLRRFEQEARAASALNHPNIITIYEIDQAERTHFMAAEFVDGGTLKNWSQAERRTWRETAALLVGVADGLAAAHAAGVVHRDVKPDNILISKNGIAKLGDFGLATLFQGADSDGVATRDAVDRKRPDIIMGTIPYMSPEQASGRTIDARSDIFSFGVVLYEMVARRRPFESATELEQLQAIIHAPHQPLSENLPFELRLIVDKALEKDVADRYQTMQDLVVDLKRVLRKQFAVTTPVAVPKVRRRWLPWAAVAGLAAVIGVWETVRPAALENPLANAQFTRLTDFPGAEIDAAISPDGKFVALLSDRDGPFQVWLSQVGSGRFVKLHDADERSVVQSLGFSGDGTEIWLGGSAPVIEGVNIRRLRLMPSIGGPLRPFLGERVVNVAWSHDAARVVYHTNEPGDPMFVADRAGTNARQIFAARPGVHNHYPAFSPDGRWIYFVSGIWETYEMDLYRIPSSGGEPERLTHLNNDLVDVTPLDQSTVLYVAPAEDRSGPWLWAFNVDGKTSRRLSFGLEKYTSVSASADGRRIVATIANPSANLWSVPILDRMAQTADVKPFPLPTVRALSPRFGATSLFYLSSRGAGDGLWRYQDGQAFEIWNGSNGALREPPAVSREGSRVAIVLRQDGKLRLHIMSSDGAQLQALSDTIDVRGTASWSPDGRWIVTDGYDASGEALFRIPVDGGEPVRLAVGTVFNPVWSPDGNLIVYTGPTVGPDAPLQAVRPDGTPIELPMIRIPVEGQRYRFLPDSSGLVYMQARKEFLFQQDFWLLDLTTKTTRRLTQLDERTRPGSLQTFDITPDGKQIVFDRLQDNSDIVLIERFK